MARDASQWVRTATVGPCVCGAPAAALADAGWGRPGWRVLAPSCAACAGVRTSLSPAAFARLAGEGLRVTAAGAPRAAEAADGTPGDLGVPELAAKAALLQARLDWFQTQLARLGEQGPGGAAQG